jgi:hypothetical protein
MYYNILTKIQQDFLPNFKPATEIGFVLYGGTAIAMHLGHRHSVDFDFFHLIILVKMSLKLR